MKIKWSNLLIAAILALLFILILLELRAIGGEMVPSIIFQKSKDRMVEIKLVSEAQIIMDEYINDEIFERKIYLLQSIIDNDGNVVFERPLVTDGD